MIAEVTDSPVSYYQSRLTQLGLKQDQLLFTRTWTQPNDVVENGSIINKLTEHKKDYLLLDSNSVGDVVIRYFNLDGQPY